jgi:hypothetical protein
VKTKDQPKRQAGRAVKWPHANGCGTPVCVCVWQASGRTTGLLARLLQGSMVQYTSQPSAAEPAFMSAHCSACVLPREGSAAVATPPSSCSSREKPVAMACERPQRRRMSAEAQRCQRRGAAARTFPSFTSTQPTQYAVSTGGESRACSHATRIHARSASPLSTRAAPVAAVAPAAVAVAAAAAAVGEQHTHDDAPLSAAAVSASMAVWRSAPASIIRPQRESSGRRLSSLASSSYCSG